MSETTNSVATTSEPKKVNKNGQRVVKPFDHCFKTVEELNEARTKALADGSLPRAVRKFKLTNKGTGVIAYVLAYNETDSGGHALEALGIDVVELDPTTTRVAKVEPTHDGVIEAMEKLGLPKAELDRCKKMIEENKKKQAAATATTK